MLWIRPTKYLIGVVAVALVATACAGTSTSTTVDVSGSDSALLRSRLDEIDTAVATWRAAASSTDALIAAEAAANLVVGPNGPGYGDRNGDGVVSGATNVGLLPGLDGTPTGLAAFPEANDCIVKNVLGGSWDDPASRWQEMVVAIEDWRPDNNTMPTLASHPMRIVGWASFSLATGSRDKMQEYAGHAALHINISQRALNCT